ncbi:polysaccharide biosynthesis protein [Hoeflea olei]|uniref:polysaccharide biosynthesis protein n=1 Tax=Hoeflea olei TaxID=1480615 RepID=UPI001FD93143|nr:polysaccharide biosynthesis protein [Hoeflea olei]
MSLLTDDLRKFSGTLTERVKGKRILAIGAAGSIGSSTVEVLAGFEPASLHVVDHNENELAELVRTLRSREQALAVADFRTLPLDYGSPAMRLLLHEEGPYDIVLNFAAIKHVRSEKDVFSMLQMFDTNFLKQSQLLRWLGETGFTGRFFSVSTDKAANPSSFMGASKRLMEHVMFSGEAAEGLKATITSARFANVAFSNGSLLQSFERRLQQGQPLAAPRDTRRYFVSLEESGQLCALASVCGPDQHIMVPKLDPDEHLLPLENMARSFLEAMGYTPEIMTEEAEARASVARLRAEGRWPLLLTPLDTAGEKPYEEFVAEGETALDVGFGELMAIAYKPAEKGLVSALIKDVEAIFRDTASLARPPSLDKDRLKTLVARIEPSFLTTHKYSDKTLDLRV